MGQRVMERPWQVVAGDITGPFVRSMSGFEYILVFQDLFSRWVEAIPIKKANAKTILRELKNRVILRFGTPEVFLSDNGTEFKNKADDEYLASIGVLHATTPPYHPQANPVERVNRTLKTRLVAYIEETHAQWDLKLPELIFSLNNSVHSATGMTPALLNFGRQPMPPATLRREQKRVAQGSGSAMHSRHGRSGSKGCSSSARMPQLVRRLSMTAKRHTTMRGGEILTTKSGVQY